MYITYPLLTRWIFLHNIDISILGINVICLKQRLIKKWQMKNMPKTNFSVNCNKLATKKHMGQVTKMLLSRYLVLLSVWDSRTFVTWPIYLFEMGQVTPANTLEPLHWHHTNDSSCQGIVRLVSTTASLHFVTNMVAAMTSSTAMIYMGQVTKVRLSCYLVLLSFDSKTMQQNSRSSVTWPIFGLMNAMTWYPIIYCSLCNSPADRVPVDEIYRYLIFWVTWQEWQGTGTVFPAMYTRVTYPETKNP